MSSKSCCTAEQKGRPGSPELPNVRVSDATPAKRPLLPKSSGSPGSRFTSARSEDLHELRQIFEGAKNSEDSRHSSPTKPHRSPFARPSMYSLHSLHKMKSIHALIKRKFSRDLVKATSNTHLKEARLRTENPDTVVKVPREGPNTQLKITKADLKKDLLSDRQPDEGGYDPDAEVLDDITKNIGKKSPAKRPSIHSVEWQSSPGSKQTLAFSTGRRSSEQECNNQPYQIISPRPISKIPIASRFSQFTSSPNLRVNTSKSKDRKLRRSHSTTSIDLALPLPLSPMRLPSMTLNDPDAVPWSKSMHESLRLSQFPVPPRQPSSESSRSSLHVNLGSKETENKKPSDESEVSEESVKAAKLAPYSKTGQLQIHIQQPTSPRVSGSIHDSTRDYMPPMKKASMKEVDDNEVDNNPRRSIHLYSMRISHHLRSGSLLSWDNLADGPEVPSPSRPIRDRTPSDQSCVSQIHHLSQSTRRERQTSSSGFASSRVPSKWGRVLPQGRENREEMSSIYSSRPQSPLDSFGRSMMNRSKSVTHFDMLRPTAADVAQRRNSDSFPTTNNEDTRRPSSRYDITNSQAAASTSTKNPLLETHIPLARNNSVANTKKSKFREEFSPSPPRKGPSISIMKFLSPKRSSVRSQSETDLKAKSIRVDGPSDQLQPGGPSRERRLSRSLMSLQTEKCAAGKEKMAANAVWEKALKAHQEERASMFLPKNKDLANQGSPFRARSGSMMRPRESMNEEIFPLQPLQPLHASKRLSVPFLEASTFSTSKRLLAPFTETPAPDEPRPDFVPMLFKRRSALIHKDEDSADPDHEVQVAFDRQTDDATTVGAWGRYPSHSRPGRSNSAGHADNIQSRDFALENAVRFAMGGNIHSDEEIDPTTRPESPPLINGKKRKKRVGSGRMAKSNSMTFGKQFLKNYTKIFRSQSTEFQRHGHGHRSSIATGGMLEYPELEILPEVWRRGIVEEQSRDNSDGSRNSSGAERSGKEDKRGKGKMKTGDSMATLRPKNEITSNSTIALDGTTILSPTDRAHVWSVYYEDCVPSFPHAGLDWQRSPSVDAEDLELRGFGMMPARHSFDLSRHSMTRHHSTMPARLGKHSRHGSRMSRKSIISHSSARPSFVSMGDVDGGDLDGTDERSIVSVRKSTMDLIAMYREQEAMERERVLSLVRMESIRTPSG